MQPFFTDRLVAIPSSEGGAITLTPSGNNKIPQHLIPSGASAAAITFNPTPQRWISFDDNEVVTFGSFSTMEQLLIPNRSLIDAVRLDPDFTWYIQFFRTS